MLCFLFQWFKGRMTMMHNTKIPEEKKLCPCGERDVSLATRRIFKGRDTENILYLIFPSPIMNKIYKKESKTPSLQTTSFRLSNSIVF
jgi:hypothetical protein